MKRNLFLTCLLIFMLILSSCGFLPDVTDDPAEEPIVEASSTPEPTETTDPTETPLPTAPPLATYTPTSEPTPEPTITLTPEPEEERFSFFSINNISSIQMTTIQMAGMEEPERIKKVAWFVAPVASVGFLSDEKLTIYENTSSELSMEVNIPEEYYVFDISPTGNLIAVTDDFERVLLLESTNLEIRTVILPETYISYVHFDPNGWKVLITSTDEMVAIEADTGTGEILKTHSGFTTAAPVYDAVFGRYTNNIFWYARGRLQLQNPISELLSTDFRHEVWINSFAISPDGEHLAVATAKTTETYNSAGIQLWHIATGMDLDFIPTENMPGSLVYSPDGTLLIGTNGEKLAFWNATTGELIQEVTGHIEGIYKASLSPEGDVILTVSNDGQAILWTLP